ncbi:MAG: alpha/beta fold hydrolase [Chthoniobacterales bacterium]
MTRWIVSALVALPACAAAAADTDVVPVPSKECVFVVHGLARGNRSMAKLSMRLSRAGYAVVKVDYPSTKGSFRDMVFALARAVDLHGTSCGKVHFVGYSLGALVVRGYLEEASLPRLGRVVLIAPPNHGSQIADALSRFREFGKLMGPVATQLGTAPEDIPGQLESPRYRLGIIAGDRSINPLGWLFIPGKHDGTVSVASARLDGMSDFLLVHRTHPFIMNAPEVAKATIRFLRSGSF